MRRILHGLEHHLCNVRFCYCVNWGFIQVHFTALLCLLTISHTSYPWAYGFLFRCTYPGNTRSIVGPAVLCKAGI